MVDSVTSSLNTGDAFGYSNIDYLPKLDQIRNLIVLDKRCASKPGWAADAICRKGKVVDQQQWLWGDDADFGLVQSSFSKWLMWVKQ